jgi:hypothetical protein
MTQESYETSDPREFDSSGIPSGESVCFTGTGALFWNMAETDAENAQLSEASASERAVHVGDRVGILVDIAVGSMAILKNGKQVLLRKGLPVGQSMRCGVRVFTRPLCVLFHVVGRVVVALRALLLLVCIMYVSCMPLSTGLHPGAVRRRAQSGQDEASELCFGCSVWRRFFVGCSKVGTSWTIVPSRKVSHSSSARRLGAFTCSLYFLLSSFPSSPAPRDPFL